MHKNWFTLFLSLESLFIFLCLIWYDIVALTEHMAHHIYIASAAAAAS